MRSFEEINVDVNHAVSINDAETLLRNAEELVALGTPKALAAAYTARGTASRLQGSYPEALEYHHRALEMYTELGDRAGVAIVTGHIGTVRVMTGSYPEALERYHRALEVHEERGDRVEAARVTINIGTIYALTGSYPEALEYYHRALEIYTELSNRSGVASVTGNVGLVHLRTGRFQEALEHYHRTLEIRTELGDRAGEALVTGNIISALLRMERYTEAEVLLLKMDAMKIGDPSVVIDREMHRASILEHHGQLEAAKVALKAGLETAEHHAMSEKRVDMHQRLRDLALQQNDLASYVAHNNEYLRITDEIRGKEATQKMAMIEAERRIQGERRERDKERALLYGALPESVATRMLRGEDVSGDHYENTAVLFMDIAGFTRISDLIPPGHVVLLLKAIFEVCDEVCKAHGLTKIKTIGDSYLAVAGVPEPLDQHVQRTAQAALEMLDRLNNLELTMDPKLGDTSWTADVGEIQVRIGLHCGPLVAGIVGTERLQYDVWGDTVNVASRMESRGEPGKIHVSEAFASALCRVPGATKKPGGAEGSLEPGTWNLKLRGETEIKGKGTMTTYWLEGGE